MLIYLAIYMNPIPMLSNNISNLRDQKDLVTVISIDFITTDKIAQNIGFAKDSELRAETNIIRVQPADRKR